MYAGEMRTARSRDGGVAETPEYLRYLTPGKRLPDHLLGQKLRLLVVFLQLGGIDIHLRF